MSRLSAEYKSAEEAVTDLHALVDEAAKDLENPECMMRLAELGE